MLRQLIALTGVCCLVSAEVAPEPVMVDGQTLAFAVPDERNAAIYYLQAALMMREVRANKIALDWTDQKTPPPDQAEQANAEYLHFLHLGAAMPSCTFGTMPNVSWRGATAQMPMIGNIRTLARLSLARAEWRFRHGQISAGLMDVRDSLIMGGQFCDHGTLIQYLVGTTVQSMALASASRNLPRCDEATRRSFARVLRSASVTPRSPRTAVLEVELAMMQRAYQNLAADPRPFEAYLKMSQVGVIEAPAGNDEERKAAEQRIRTELAWSPAQYQAVADELKALWVDWDALALQPDAERARQLPVLRERERLVKEHSLLVGTMIPALEFITKLYRTKMVQQTLLAEICELPDLAMVDSLAGRETLCGALTITSEAPNRIDLKVPDTKPEKPPKVLLTIGGWLDHKPAPAPVPAPNVLDEAPALPEEKVDF